MQNCPNEAFPNCGLSATLSTPIKVGTNERESVTSAMAKLIIVDLPVWRSRDDFPRRVESLSLMSAK